MAKEIVFSRPYFHPHKADVIALLRQLEAGQDDAASFNDIRRMLNLNTAELPDGILEQIARDEGFVVEEGGEENGNEGS